MPPLSLISPYVGKSGPCILLFSINSSILSFLDSDGSSIIAIVASITSTKLCGGMLVAIPTAIPVEPLTNKFGTLVGRTDGSFSDPS